MKILALEFSSSQRSVAVAVNEYHVREVIEISPGHAMRPVRMIESALGEAGIDRLEIQRIVVGLGPGSYTGIRAAIAMARGWQLAREVTVVGLSSIEALAAQAQADGFRGRVDIVVGAQRGEFYLASWELSDAGQSEAEALRIAGCDEMRAREASGKVFVGPEVTRWFPSGKIVFPRAAMLAMLSSKHPELAESGGLEPIYLREISYVKSPPPRAGFV